MANSGNVMSIKTGRFVPSLSRNLSVQPRLSSNLPSGVNLGSLENMQFQLRCILETDNATDMDLAAELLNSVLTNGYKLLWYDYTSESVEDNNGQLIYRIAQNSKFGHQFTSGEETFWSLSAQFYHLHVLFNDIQMTHDGGSPGRIEYTLQGVVLPVPSSTNTPS